MMRPTLALLVSAILLLAAPLGGDEAPPAAPRAAPPASPPAAPPAAQPQAAPTAEPQAAPTAEPQAAPHAESPTDAADLLRGPSVTAATVEPTILQRDFNGRVRVLDDEPEVAALRLLLVDPELRSALDSITTRRISDFDELVRSHVPELLQGVAALQRLEAAASAGERLAAIGSFSHAWLAFAPWRDRGSAIDEMGDRLDDSTRRIAQRLVGKYRSALLVERAADLGVPARNPQAILTVRLESFARMVEQSFERQTRSGEQDFDRFVKALDLTPAQTERARVIFGALYEKEVARTATGWDRFKAITDFMEELPARQRARAWKFLRAEGG